MEAKGTRISPIIVAAGLLWRVEDHRDVMGFYSALGPDQVGPHFDTRQRGSHAAQYQETTAVRFG